MPPPTSFFYFFIFTIIITPPHWQPNAVFGGFISISGAWTLLCKQIIMAEESTHVTLS